MSPIHRTLASNLREGDRVLLKDLRVLTVTSLTQQGVAVTIRYENVASNDRDILVVPLSQEVKIICPGWCHIEQELAALI